MSILCSVASEDEDLDSTGLGLFGGGSTVLTFFGLACSIHQLLLYHRSVCEPTITSCGYYNSGFEIFSLVSSQGSNSKKATLAR